MSILLDQLSFWSIVQLCDKINCKAEGYTFKVQKILFFILFFLVIWDPSSLEAELGQVREAGRKQILRCGRFREVVRGPWQRWCWNKGREKNVSILAELGILLYIMPRWCHCRGSHVGRKSLSCGTELPFRFSGSIEGCEVSSPLRKSSVHTRRGQEDKTFSPSTLPHYESSCFQIIHTFPNSSVQKYA